MIKKMSHYLAEKLNEVSPRESLERIKIEYAIELVLDKTVIMAIMLIACALVGFPFEALCCLLSCTILRGFAGGYHMNTRIGCTLTSGCIIIGGGYVASIVSFPCYVIIAIMTVDIVFLFFFAPRATENTPIALSLRGKRKAESIVTIVVYMTMSFVFYDTGIGDALVIGASAEVLSILPLWKVIENHGQDRYAEN